MPKVEYEDGVYHGSLSGVRAVTITDRSRVPESYHAQSERLMGEVVKWMGDHPEAVVLRVELDAWDDGDQLMLRGGTPTDRLLIQLSMHPSQTAGTMSRVQCTQTATVYYDLGKVEVKLYDWEAEQWA